MTRSILAGSAAVLVSLGTTLFSLQANAQQEGVYQGQTADGNPVTVEVAKTDDGRFGLFFFDTGFTSNCEGNKHPFHGDVAEFFPENHFVNNQKKFNFTEFHVFHGEGQIVFQSDTEATGTIAASEAVFPRGHGTPDSAEYCASPAQDFSVTFQFGGAAAHHSLADSKNSQDARKAHLWRH